MLVLRWPGRRARRADCSHLGTRRHHDCSSRSISASVQRFVLRHGLRIDAVRHAYAVSPAGDGGSRCGAVVTTGPSAACARGSCATAGSSTPGTRSSRAATHTSVRELLARAARRPARRRSSTAKASPLDDVELDVAGAGPGQDHLHRPQLPRARGRGGHRPARRRPTFFAKFRNALVPDRRGGDAARRQREGRLRGRGRVRDRPPLPATSSEARRARARRRLHAAQRPLGARPPVRDAAVDARQGVRRLGAVRTRRSSRRTRPAPHDAIAIALTLNGETMQSADTGDLIFSVPALVVAPLAA